MKSDRITVCECPEFTIELEYTPTLVMWHTKTVSNFNRASYRKMKAFSDQLEKFLRLHYDCLWTAMDPSRADLARLAKHGGFRFHSHADGLDIYQKTWSDEDASSGDCSCGS